MNLEFCVFTPPRPAAVSFANIVECEQKEKQKYITEKMHVFLGVVVVIAKGALLQIKHKLVGL